MRITPTNLGFAMLWKTTAAALMVSGSPAEITAPQMSDASTHEQIVFKMRQSDQQDPMRNMKLAKGPDPSKVNQPESLLATSDVVCFGGSAVLIPKRAILQLPPELAERLKYQPGAELQSWADFFAANRGWITTVEVTRAQAEGGVPVEAMSQPHITKSANLIVATYLSGPISVLPPKAPVAAKTNPVKP